MSDTVGGLKTKIKEKYPTAVYFHCVAHKLVLIVTDTCKHIRSSVFLFKFIRIAICSFFSTSHSQYIYFNVKKLELKLHGIIQISTTRWACRYKNCHNFNINYEATINVLQEEINNNKNKYVDKAFNLRKGIKKSTNYLCLMTFY